MPITEDELEKFGREEYRDIIDKYTEVNAQLDLWLRRVETKYLADLQALPADTVIDGNRPDGVGGIPVVEILEFYALIKSLQSALPDGSTDKFTARRVRALRVS